MSEQHSAIPSLVDTLSAKQVGQTIDHALLRPTMTRSEVKEGCLLCDKYHAYSVCVRPCDVKFASDILKDSPVQVGTVIGFPHGTTSTSAKVAEALQALKDGAGELDMVANQAYIKSDMMDQVQRDIQQVVEAAKKQMPGCCVKVILECTVLTDEEKIAVCKAAENAGADYVKTSTGFAGGGATVHDLKLMRASVGKDVKVKASGGVRTLDDLVQCLQAGAERIGTSATVEIVQQMQRLQDSR
ncbi:hypothetical protein GGI07_000221 [Coemansia sp. Benny D115]|nr:hypothetical protein GGI07_000221 [Coemansia sp. Benny D115]